MTSAASSPPVTGLALAGAAALGAYQVGVLSHVVEEVALELARPLRFDVLTGTSAGAMHAAALATAADDLTSAVARLRDVWSGLRLEQMLRPSAVEVLAMLTDLTGRGTLRQRAMLALGVRGGLLDPEPVARLCRLAVDGTAIDAHLRAGRLQAVAVAATQVSTGRAVVFHQARRPPRRGGATVMAAVQLAPDHALASAAVPLLFPAVAIDGDLYCDGGLRQMVPLSPALHFGTRRLLAVSSVAPAPASPDASAARAHLAASSSPLYLAGKALHALFTDGIVGDLDRVTQLDRVLEAGRRRFGATFLDELNAELAEMEAPPLHPVQLLHLAPSCDVGALAAAHVTDPGFTRRIHGAAARALRWIADGDPTRAGDLLSYLLFDGGFADRLMDLGRCDARARHDELVRFFAGGEA